MDKSSKKHGGGRKPREYKAKRSSIYIDEDIMSEVSKQAKSEKIPFTRVVERALARLMLVESENGKSKLNRISNILKEKNLESGIYLLDGVQMHNVYIVLIIAIKTLFFQEIHTKMLPGLSMKMPYATESESNVFPERLFEESRARVIELFSSILGLSEIESADIIDSCLVKLRDERRNEIESAIREGVSKNVRT